MRTEYLKELELLPLWQLRKPLAHLAEVEQSQPQNRTQVDFAPQEPIKPEECASPNVAIFASEDNHLQLMSVSDGLNQEAQQLLQNIAKSMQLKPQAVMSLDGALQQPITVVLVLGESLAQSVLTSQQELQTLRGQVHHLEGKQVVVTEGLEAMLGQPKIKAQVWKDCCMAMSLLVG